MKELLTEYASYNLWANKRIIAAMLALPQGATEQQIESSFPTIKDTVLHTWSAEDTWLQRLMLTENPIWAADGFTGTFEELCNNWVASSEALIAFVRKQYNEASFTHELVYYDRKKHSHKTPVYQVLHHVFNHATYHRGQLVTMLRQAGCTAVPGTDFILFARGK